MKKTYLPIVFIGIFTWVSITSTVQSFVNPHLTQTQVFFKIPESIICDFHDEDKYDNHYFSDLSIQHSKDGKKWVEVNRAKKTGERSFSIWPKTDTIPFGTIVNLHYDTVNNNYILMNKDSFVYVIHIKCKKQ